MNNEWLFQCWLQIAEAFLFALIIFDLAAIAVVLALAGIERLLRRELFHEPVTLKDVARQVAEIRMAQQKEPTCVVLKLNTEIKTEDFERVIQKMCSDHNVAARLFNQGRES